ncbi:hypothetical protein HPP92_003976 [Vanilla planifolia]|uniref:Uncharacterized protein n=1 Tax=Vanilla planifolia TaxID=51239 RepID=A0A835VKF5_VANPL|nr:hypothetical protein HPP92_003976 [Vanilla planifolia]
MNEEKVKKGEIEGVGEAMDVVEEDRLITTMMLKTKVDLALLAHDCFDEACETNLL